MSLESHHVSSRLVKKEQRQLVLQTIGFVLAGIAILGVFIGVLMPVGIKYFFKFLDSNKGLEVTDKIPPQVPVLSAPIEATSSATIAFTGYAEADSMVVFVVNGAEVTRAKTATDGAFTQELRLEQGDNSLELFGADAAGNESTKSTPYHIYMDNQPVEITIDEPADGAQVTGRSSQNLTIKGKAKPSAKIYVNDRLSYANSDGSFSTLYALSEGENKIKVRVVDKAGNQAEKELTIQFRY